MNKFQKTSFTFFSSSSLLSCTSLVVNVYKPISFVTDIPNIQPWQAFSA
jgi:hypothetical protein